MDVVEELGELEAELGELEAAPVEGVRLLVQFRMDVWRSHLEVCSWRFCKTG